MELTRPALVPGMRLPIQWLIGILAGASLLFVLSILVAKLGAFVAMAAVSALLIGCALCLLPPTLLMEAGFIVESGEALE